MEVATSQEDMMGYRLFCFYVKPEARKVRSERDEGDKGLHLAAQKDYKYP